VIRSSCRQNARQVGQFLDRIADTDTASVVAAYEKRITALEEQKLVVAERIANCGRPLTDFDGTLKTALDFIASPCQFWQSERLEDKRALLKLAFSDSLVYTRNEGLKTPSVSLPFKVLESFREGKSVMARPARDSSNPFSEPSHLFDTLEYWAKILKALPNSLMRSMA